MLTDKDILIHISIPEKNVKSILFSAVKALPNTGRRMLYFPL